jgi:hypothetical protein
MAAVTYIKLIAEAKKLIPRFYREYKGASDWWHAVKIDGKVFELNFTTHDPEGTGSFPKKKQDKVKIVAYPNGIDGKFVRLGYFQGMRQTNENPKRCWKGYAPVRGKKPYSKGSCRKVRGNPARQPDEAMVRELQLFFQNDEYLMNRRFPEFAKNIKNKVRRGIYDPEKAVKLFMYLADEISKKYSKDFGDGKTHAADVPTRMALAKAIRDMNFDSEGESYGTRDEDNQRLKDEMADLQEPMGIIRGKRVIRGNSSCGVTKGTRMNPAPAGYHYMPDGRLMADSGHSKNPPELFKKGGYAVVVEFKSGDSQIGEAFPTEAQANSQMRYLMQQYVRLKLTRGLDNVSAIRVLPVTSVAR